MHGRGVQTEGRFSALAQALRPQSRPRDAGVDLQAGGGAAAV
jgi:hypothetical protein